MRETLVLSVAIIYYVLISMQSLFKSGKMQQAIQCYSKAATLAVQRPSWETHQFMREELSTTVSNRSAAYFDAKDYVSALADAETVIAVRRNWPKGHYRKAKALLGLARPKEAIDAVKLGLSYEPNNKVRSSMLQPLSFSDSRTGTWFFSL